MLAETSPLIVGAIMAIETLLVLLLVGAAAGFLAGQVVEGYGFGLIGNVVLGIIGAFVANWFLPKLGLYSGGTIIGDIVYAAIGAIIVLLVAGLVRRVVA